MKRSVKKDSKSNKEEKEMSVLFHLIKLYIATGKSVGSQALRDFAFKNLSASTIRNYFASLESKKLLVQAHVSGGRIPTNEAFSIYAKHCWENVENVKVNGENRESLGTVRVMEYLQEKARVLCEKAQLPVFFSAPRFDHDFIIDVKCCKIGNKQIVGILMTNFGLIETEVLQVNDCEITDDTMKNLEKYFAYKLNKENVGEPSFDEGEKCIVERFYQEIMVRYMTRYSFYKCDEVYKMGFSQLLNYAEFNQVVNLANALAILENKDSVGLIVKNVLERQKVSWWIGRELDNVHCTNESCCVIAAPYKINQTVVGVIGILGPVRIYYDKIFFILNSLVEEVSVCLTRTIHKFQIQMRKSHRETFLNKKHIKCLENKKQK